MPIVAHHIGGGIIYWAQYLSELRDDDRIADDVMRETGNPKDLTTI
jgi:hypothetical protein